MKNKIRNIGTIRLKMSAYFALNVTCTILVQSLSYRPDRIHKISGTNRHIEQLQVVDGHADMIMDAV